MNNGSPTSTGWRIYTDGSKSNNGVGCAYTVYKNSTLIDNKSFSLAPHCSVLQAETFAILKAAEYILNVGNYMETWSIRILSDSQSAIKALSNFQSKKALTWETRQKIISSPISTTLEWVKAHNEDQYNNEVDLLAKQASTIRPFSFEKVPHSLTRSEIESSILNKYYANYKRKPKN